MPFKRLCLSSKEANTDFVKMIECYLLVVMREMNCRIRPSED